MARPSTKESPMIEIKVHPRGGSNPPPPSPSHEFKPFKDWDSWLVKIGALEFKKAFEERQEWRLVTCMWLHAGLFHIFANMLGLAFIGFRLEKEFGYLRIGVLYVLSGIGGSILSSLFIRTTISVGASGSLFGLLGAMLSELLTNWTIYVNKFAALLTLILIVLINIVFGFIPHVDNYAHIGGFFTGFFLGFVILIRPQFKWINQKHVPPGYVAPTTRSKYKCYQCILLIISLIALLVGFLVSLILLYHGVDGNDYCSWCHYLTCIPTPLWTCSSRCSLSQLDKQVNMTCLPNGRFNSYTLGDPNNTIEIQNWYQSKSEKPMRKRLQQDFIQRKMKREKEASIEEDLIQIKGRTYSTKVSTFNEYVAFLNLIKQDDVVSQEWDKFRKKFDKVVKWFYNYYLDISLPGSIPPTINGVQIHLFDLYKLVDGLGGYLSVYFGQEFGTIGEILGLSKQDGEEVKKCYIKYLDVFTSYYKTARVPQQEYNCILNNPTKKVEEDIEKICLMSHQWDFDETCAPLKSTIDQKGKGKLEHFGVKLKDTKDGEDSQP
uniref:RHOMBOID-like protein n=1 Tax=Tanacetum cinerariifolium TaxID=118510 RepID=A0A6L2MLN8_TANCI|nr:rhomboid-like protein 1 [Tanacetum cinerariifolium]